MAAKKIKRIRPNFNILLMVGVLGIIGGLGNYFIKSYNLIYLLVVFLIGLSLVLAALLVDAPKSKR